LIASIFRPYVSDQSFLATIARHAYDQPVTRLPFDLSRIRTDFPTLGQHVNGRRLAYLDNGATTQKPDAAIDAVSGFYRLHNANIHRAVHHLSQHATDLYEHARIKIQRFISAPSKEEVIFTRGTTEAINLVAHSFSRLACKPQDEIVVSTFEHHSNIVPWQIAAAERGLTLRVIPIDDTGELLYDELPKLLSSKTKLIAITHTSNALGTIIDIPRIVAAAKTVGAAVLVDGAQWVGHSPLDVQSLGVDFYVFSGHKLFGPTGVGVLWGKREWLDKMPPYQSGGDMIKTVSFSQGTTFADLPNKFEAGTPDIAGVIGLGAAIDYLNALDREGAAKHEHALLDHCTKQLQAIEGIRIVGTAKNKASIVSFVMDSPAVDAHTLGTLLDNEGVAVRTGHHCCMPLMERLGVTGTVRASMSFYNSMEDVDQLVAGVKKIRDSFAAKQEVSLPDPNDSVPYGPTRAASPEEIANELVADLELFDDREQKNDYIIDLGKKVKPLPAWAKNEHNRVHGCQSTVFLSGRGRPGSQGVIEFAAESDAFIVNGLIYLLTAVFSGQRASDVLAFDHEAFFAKLGLDQHLSMGRRNGLAGMVSRIRRLAAANADEATIAKLKAGVS
jgi:cysteine desulfurase / selenocysteine lyase